VIPVFARFENPHKTTTESGNNFVRLNDEGQTHLKNADLISEVAFLTELAHRLHGATPIHWRKLQDTRYVRQLIAQTIPGFEPMATLDNTQAEFTISGRIFHAPQFATPSGKATMFVTPLPCLTLPTLQDFKIPATADGLVVALSTGRSYAQHNTVVYRNADQYRGMPHRNCILMNAVDIAQVGFSEHQRVNVTGDAGQLENVEIISGQIRQGAALMFYPEVNILFKARIDPQCGTPAFKRVPIAVWVNSRHSKHAS
jgi:anaerobic selenocysteine-containing dehydrogenase